ncbi:hypothetical protein IMY05_C2998003900 [Salix suchowensis]|nr:hypothetical protein IMY05_C2998003900 [Salix suchowensis]
MLNSQSQIILFKPAPLSTPLHDIFLFLPKPDLRAFPSFDPGPSFSLVALTCQEKVINDQIQYNGSHSRLRLPRFHGLDWDLFNV